MRKIQRWKSWRCDWEKEGKIKIKAFVFDISKMLMDLIGEHGFVMRIPCHEWLLKEIDRGKSMGNKHVELDIRLSYTGKMINDEKRSGKYSLIITNLKMDVLQTNRQELPQELPQHNCHRGGSICVYIMMIIIIYMFGQL